MRSPLGLLVVRRAATRSALYQFCEFCSSQKGGTSKIVNSYRLARCRVDVILLGGAVAPGSHAASSSSSHVAAAGTPKTPATGEYVGHCLDPPTASEEPYTTIRGVHNNPWCLYDYGP